MHPWRRRSSRLAKRPLYLGRREDRLAPADLVEFGGFRYFPANAKGPRGLRQSHAGTTADRY